MDIKRLERLCRVDSRATRENPQNFRSDPSSAQRLGQFSNSSCNLALGVRIRGAQSFKSDKSVQMCCKQIFQAYLCKCLRNEGKNTFMSIYFQTHILTIFQTQTSRLFSIQNPFHKVKSLGSIKLCNRKTAVILKL